MTDPYSRYEQGVEELLARLGKDHPQYAAALVQQTRLLENIASTRRYGPTEELRHERAEVLDRLHELALAAGARSFLDLCPPGPPEEISPAALLPAYYRALAADCRRLPLGVVAPRFVEAGPADRVPLPDVYVDLDVLAPAREEQERAGKAFLERMARGEGRERTPLLEAIAHPQVTRFVLLGDPGSGKTTFVNYLTYLLADAAGAGGAAPLPAGSPLAGLLPFRLVLREVGARCIPAAAARGEAQMLWNALRADIAARLGEEAAQALFPMLQQRLLGEGGLVLLDGLDEVPEADRRRQCLLEAVADLAGLLPAGRSRVLVTARPYAYAAPHWRLAEFATLLLAPLDGAQQERFIGRWYQAVRPAMKWDEATAAGRAGRLRQALAERPYLADLASRPLLLTLMATLHTSWGQLPEDRADLYEETVKLLLSRWQRGGEARGPDGEAVLDPGVARVLALEEGRVRPALHRLAYTVHERQRQSGEAERPADIGAGEVLAAFAPLLPEDLNPRLLVRYLETRAGLLLARAPGVYAFPHRSFQEYLAACYLAEETDLAAALQERVWQDPAWWREVFLLGVGKARQGGLSYAVHVVNTLLPEGPEEVAGKSATHWQAAVLAGQALADLRFPGVAQDKPPLQAVLKRVQRWLVALLEAPADLAPRERAAAGDVLALLGDPRPGVGLDAAGLPDLDWVAVPAGPFRMGDDRSGERDERPAHEVHLPTFRLARYPVTNVQYAAFARATGRMWRGADFAPRQAHHPAVYVTWHDAVAFCEWLTARWREAGRLGADEVVRLPTEAEWERAARGTDGREYPWGEWAAGRANTLESGIHATSAVGCFAAWNSPCGCADMTGNVWEWCSSLYRPYPYRADDGREKAGAGGSRVLRGGSWSDTREDGRSAFRDSDFPGLDIDFGGFRCCLAARPFSP